MSTREFLLATEWPGNAPRLAPAVQTIRRVLSECDSVGWTTLARTAHAASPSLSALTVKNWLHDANRAGLIVVSGRYRSPRDDTREVRLGDW